MNDRPKDQARSNRPFRLGRERLKHKLCVRFLSKRITEEPFHRNGKYLNSINDRCSIALETVFWKNIRNVSDAR